MIPSRSLRALALLAACPVPVGYARAADEQASKVEQLTGGRTKVVWEGGTHQAVGPKAALAGYDSADGKPRIVTQSPGWHMPFFTPDVRKAIYETNRGGAWLCATPDGKRLWGSLTDSQTQSMFDIASQIYLGRFNANYTGVEDWVQITDNGGINFWSHAWVEPPGGRGKPRPAAGTGSAASPGGGKPSPAGQPGVWPSDRQDLVFAWENGDAIGTKPVVGCGVWRSGEAA